MADVFSNKIAHDLLYNIYIVGHELHFKKLLAKNFTCKKLGPGCFPKTFVIYWVY